MRSFFRVRQVLYSNLLSFRLSVYILYVSFIFAIAFSVLLAYKDFQNKNLQMVRQQMVIQQSYIDSIGYALWITDMKQAQFIAKGILTLDNIEYLALEGIDLDKFTVGELQPQIEYKYFNYTINYFDPFKHKTTQVGTLKVAYNYTTVINQFISGVLLNTFYQIFQSILLAIFIFYVVYMLVTKNLKIMAEFAKNTSIDNMQAKLVLPRKLGKHADELDYVVNSINEALFMLHDDIAKRKILESSLEKQVLERTISLKQSNEELSNTLVQLKETQKQVLAKEKLASLGHLVASIAHELNTPIGTCIAHSSLIQNFCKKINFGIKNSNLKKQECTEILADLDQSTSELNNNLLKAAKLVKIFKLIAAENSTDSIVQINLDVHLQNIVTGLQHKLEPYKNLQLIYKPHGDCMVLANPQSFLQIFSEMLSNSLEHAYSKDSKGIIEISFTEQDNNYISITYKDDGKGMEQEVLSKIFDPFYSSKRYSGSLGLGMYTVFNIVAQNLHGNISCSSVVGKGTIITISFPKNSAQN